MKILVLNGSPRGKGNSKAYAEAFKAGAEKKRHEVTIFDVGRMKINACLACEYCHEKEKGVCVQKDAMQDIYPDLAEAEMIVFAWQLLFNIRRFSEQNQPEICGDLCRRR